MESLGSREYQLKKYVVILSSLVATVTYAVGLNLPGGVWESTGGGHIAGDVILRDTHYHRYLMFYYCNATAFVASVVVCLLLLALERSNNKYLAPALQVVMLLDLLGLMGAYAAGTCRDAFTIIYTSLIMPVIFAYIVPSFLYYVCSKHLKNEPKISNTDNEQVCAVVEKDLKNQKTEVLMLLATFAITITYVAGLNPPGGFWSDGERASDPILKDSNPSRYHVFFVCNTTSFVASLLVVLLLLDSKIRFPYSSSSDKYDFADARRYFALYGFVVIALLGLAGAYAAGSCRELDATAYVVSLIGAVLTYIFLQVAIEYIKTKIAEKIAKKITEKITDSKNSVSGNDTDTQSHGNTTNGDYKGMEIRKNTTQFQTSINIRDHEDNESHENTTNNNNNNNNNKVETVVKSKEEEKMKALKKTSDLVLLLATLVASITYQAGLDPPGGLWRDNQGEHHRSGVSVLLTTHPMRYKVFYYSNSSAFVASLVVIVMVQSRFLLMNHTLEAAMLLDLLSLIGAYAAGSCRDVNTSIYVVALAGVVLVYVVIHIAFSTLNHDLENDNHMDDRVDEKREMLLLLAILVATLTYQAGLTPPGGFWPENDAATGHHAGFPVLQDNYHHRYTVFFYCNAMSFMASITLIVLLVNRNLYRICIRCHALYVCMVSGMICLLGAYAAGSSRHLRTSIYVLMLVAAVFAFVILQVIYFVIGGSNGGSEEKQDHTGDLAGGSEKKPDINKSGIESSGSKNEGNDPKAKEEEKERTNNDPREYMMLLGVLAASITYQSGLKPPGGLWPDNKGHIAGNSILHDTNAHRYHAFFYSNSTSFMASIVVVLLLLPKTLHDRELPLWRMHTAILLSMLGLLGGYAAGSTTDWNTSRYVICLVIPVLLYIAAYAVWTFLRKEMSKHKNDTIV